MAAPSPDTRTIAQVCDDMRAHFHRHGYYLAADLIRVLGDPRDSVSMTCAPPCFFVRIDRPAS